MEELIKITEREGQQIISARDLYYFLESKERFSRLMNRMFKYGFTEGIDYTPYQMVHPLNNGETLDYALTMEAAKEMSMLSRSPKGKEARLYFIECEKKAKAPQTIQTRLPNIKELAQMVIDAETEKEKVMLQLAAVSEIVEEQAPKVQYVDKVLDAVGSVHITSIADDFGWSAVKLNRMLKEKGVQYKIDGHWTLNSKYKDKGYTTYHTHVYNDSQGNQRTKIEMLWTQKGRAFIHSLFNEGLSCLLPSPSPVQPAA